jgi:thioredoxin-related protein
MKKLLTVFVFLMMVALVGCQPKYTITLNTQTDITSYVEITYTELLQKMADGDDILLYISSETCTSCEAFKPLIEAVIVDRDLVVYKIEAGASFIPDNDEVPYRYTPSLVIIQAGEVKDTFHPLDNPEFFADQDGIEQFFDQFILPN